jgi:hypothetical protein
MPAKNLQSGMWDLAVSILQAPLPVTESSGPPPAKTRVPLDSLLLLVAGVDLRVKATFPMLAVGETLDPDDFVKIIDALIKFIKELLDEAKNQGESGSWFELKQAIDAIIAELEELRRTVMASGYRIDLTWVMDLVRDYIRRAIDAIRMYGGYGPAFLAALRNRMFDFMAYIRFLLAGGEGGGVVVGAALRFGLYALAAYVGHLIGKWIAKQKYDGKPVSEWLGDALYLEYFAVSDDCNDAEAAYYAAAKARRDYERSGPTLDKSVMLDLIGKEISALFVLRETGVRKRCFDDVSVFDKVLDRLRERYRRLSGH